MERQSALRAAIALLAAHNITQNTILNESGYVTSSVLAATSLIGLAKATGADFADMGLSRQGAHESARLVACAAGAVLIGSAAALAVPDARAYMRDERAHDESIQAMRQKVLLRFPLGTALFEEVAFRGVIPVLVGRSSFEGDLASAGLFGLWHLFPAFNALTGNPLGRRLTGTNRLRAVVVGSAGAAVAGLALAGIRRRTGGLLAPWFLHSWFNIISYLAGVVAWRLDNSPQREVVRA